MITLQSTSRAKARSASTLILLNDSTKSSLIACSLLQAVVSTSITCIPKKSSRLLISSSIWKAYFGRSCNMASKNIEVYDSFCEEDQMSITQPANVVYLENVSGFLTPCVGAGNDRYNGAT